MSAFTVGCSSTKKTQPPPEVTRGNVNVVTETSPAIVGGPEELHKHLRYPPKALKEDIAITLKANVLVNRNGKIEQITFEQATEYGFRDAARDALRAVQFVPGKRNGDPINTFITVPIKFDPQQYRQ